MNLDKLQELFQSLNNTRYLGMKNILVLITLMLSFLISDLGATHIAAGFSTYKHLNDNSFEINITLIRDQFSSGSALDDEIFVQAYTFDGINYIFQGNLLVEKSETYQVSHGDQSDLAQHNSIQLAYAEYLFEFELTNPAEDYLFVYQRCCRGPNFGNIVDPSENGITLITTITKEAQALKNSSIEFNVLPRFIAIANQEQMQAIEVTSLDGDTLSFQLAPSYYGGGLAGSNGTGFAADCDGVAPQGPCYPPYNQVEYSAQEASFISPFPAWQDQGMDAQDGNLLGVPSQIGQYAYGFAIHELRNGQIINTTSFDYVVYIVSGVSQTEESPQENLKLLSNPSEGSFTLERQLDTELNLNVYNLKGEKITCSFERSENRIKIDFDGAAGMYILKVYGEEVNQSLKLIKL